MAQTVLHLSTFSKFKTYSSKTLFLLLFWHCHLPSLLCKKSSLKAGLTPLLSLSYATENDSPVALCLKILGSVHLSINHSNSFAVVPEILSVRRVGHQFLESFFSSYGKDSNYGGQGKKPSLSSAPFSPFEWFPSCYLNHMFTK